MKHIFIIFLFVVLSNKTFGQKTQKMFEISYDSTLSNPVYADTGNYMITMFGDTFKVDSFYKHKYRINKSLVKIGNDTPNFILPGVSSYLQRDTIIAEFFFDAMMGGGSGLQLKLVNNQVLVNYFDFVLSDFPEIFKNQNDTAYTREIEVPVSKVKLILKNRNYKPGEIIYGYIEGVTNPYYEKDPSDKPELVHKHFKGFFKTKLYSSAHNYFNKH